MPKFVFTYHGGQDTSSDQGAVMQAWRAFFGSLGDAVVDAGNPYAATKTINSSGNINDETGPDTATGYSIVEADDFDTALKLTEACPALANGGTVHISETIPV